MSLLCVLSSSIGDRTDLIRESGGYLVYCPCMGRFGNQADQFLGSLSFSQALGRTLVLPPWVEYSQFSASSKMVPWDTYFNTSVLEEHHKVVTMDHFMKHLADQVWPADERIAFCYTARHGGVKDSCNAKEGNPFGPFWDNFNISFIDSRMFGPLTYEVHHHPHAVTQWTSQFPVSRYPVLAFTGPPASFPVQQENLGLQRFLPWSNTWTTRAQVWLKTNLPPGPFVGLHLRNGEDWVRACQHVSSTSNLFSSPQCLGYRNEVGQLTPELCLPPLAEVVRQVRRAIKQVGAVAVFVASDSDHMLDELRQQLRRNKGVTFHRQEEGEPHLDLVILGLSNMFIGNCVSSFSAFVKRERDLVGLPTSFWAEQTDKRGKVIEQHGGEL